MQDPRNPKQGEASEAPDAQSASARRRQWQDVLNEQLRALYDTYRADEVPAELLDLAGRIEEAQRQSQHGEPSPGAGGEATRNGIQGEGRTGEHKE